MGNIYQSSLFRTYVCPDIAAKNAFDFGYHYIIFLCKFGLFFLQMLMKFCFELTTPQIYILVCLIDREFHLWGTNEI